MLLFAYCFLSQARKALQELWPPQGKYPTYYMVQSRWPQL